MGGIHHWLLGMDAPAGCRQLKRLQFAGNQLLCMLAQFTQN